MKQHDENIDKSLFEPAGVDSFSAEKIEKPSLNYWQDAWLRIKKNKAAIVSMAVLVLIILMALVGPLISGKDFSTQITSEANLPPRIQGIEHIGFLPFTGERTLKNGDVVNPYEQKGIEQYYWFGTDNLGRDLFTRVWKGTQISLLIAVVAAVIDLIIGVAYGAISGYFGGKIDNVMQRILEILMGIPNLIVVILMILILKPGIIPIIIALSITGWISMARVVRAQVMKLKEQEYVLAARTLGLNNFKIIFKHMLPNLTGVMIINTMFTIPSAIFFEAFLSFIGLGLQEPQASLGTLIDDGFKSMIAFPYQMVYPAIIISVIMIVFNLVADGVRDALDPKMKD
ncbi:ABC transporter permease [Bacillus pumilus]|nr:ABC transporter permease [Bacillus pumilus]